MQNTTLPHLLFVNFYKLIFISILVLAANFTFAQTFTSTDISLDLGNSRYVTAGDVNGDDYLDIYVSNDQGEQNRLWINDGSGNFTAMDILGDTGSSLGAAMGDVNGDTYLDIYVANYSSGQNKLWINDGSGNFTAMDITGDFGGSTKAIMGDVNGDDYLDIYVSNDQGEDPEQNRLWINDGSGNFTAMDITGDVGYSYGVAMGDVNGDDYLDIYVVNSYYTNKLWINDGSGNFTAMDITGDDSGSSGVAMGDVNGDDYLDIYTTGGQNKLWINDGSGNFSENIINHGGSQSVAIGDFNNDAFLDIYLANYHGDQNNLWLQDLPTYTVSFLDYDTTVLSTSTVTHGDDATAPTAPTRPRYTFTGWSPSDLTNITADTDFTAQYTLIPVSSSGGSGTSIPARVKNLIAQGDQEAADKIIEQRPELFATALAKLKQQLAELSAKYKALTGHDPVISTYTLGIRDLTVDDNSDEVTLLQRFLTGEGYSIPAGVTGFFGLQTESALAQFQYDKSITPAQGYYGQITRAAISALYPNVSWR